MKRGRPYAREVADISSKYESYKNEYAMQAEQFVNEQLRRQAKKEGVVFEPIQLSKRDALNVKMYDEMGLMTKYEFESMYHAKYNEALKDVESGEKKKTGNIVRSMVSEQRYRITSAQSKKMPIYFKTAESKELELAQKELTGKELEVKTLEIKKKWKDVRKSNWRYQGVDFSVLSQ
jgi:hypothetical protein